MVVENQVMVMEKQCFKLRFYFLHSAGAKISQLCQGFPRDKIIAGCSVFIAGHMTISGLIFSIFLTTYWTLKPVDQELKPVGTAGFKGLRKTLCAPCNFSLCL